MVAASTGLASELWPGDLVQVAHFRQKDAQGAGSDEPKAFGCTLEELSERFIVEPHETRTSNKTKQIGIFERVEEEAGQEEVEVKLYGFVKEINMASGGDWRGSVSRKHSHALAYSFVGTTQRRTGLE